MSGLGKKFIGGTLWMSLAQVVSYGLTFVANILLARLLTPDDFGVFALATSILSIIYILGSWSFSVAIIQTQELDQEFFDTVFFLSLGLGIALFVLTGVISLFLKKLYSEDTIVILLVLASLQVPTLLSACHSASVKRNMEYKGVSLLQICTRVLGLIIAIVLAWRGAGVWSLVSKQVVSVVGSFLGIHFISRWHFRWRFDADIAKRLFKFGTQMFFSSGLESFLSNAQGFFVGTILGTPALGYFDRGLKLCQMGNTVAESAVNQVSLAAYSRLQASERRLGVAFEVINYFLVRVFVLVGALFFLIGQDLTILLYGEQWRAAGEIMPFLSIYVVSVTVFQNVKHFLYSQAKVGVVIKTRVLQSLLLVGGMWLMLPSCGIEGAASVLSFLYLVGVGFMLMYVKRYVSVDLRRLLLIPVLAGAATVGLFGFLFFSVGWGIALREGPLVLGSGILVFFVYTGALWAMEGKQLWRNIGSLIEAAISSR